MATIPELQQLQNAMRTERKGDDLAMMQGMRGPSGPSQGMGGPPPGMAGPPPGMGGLPSGMEGPPPGPPPGTGGPPPSGLAEMLGKPPDDKETQLEPNQDIHDVLFTATNTGDSIAAMAVDSLLKSAKLDILGLMNAEEDGVLEAASGGGLMKLAANRDFSGQVPGIGHGMEDNVYMPIVERKAGDQIGTLAVSPDEYVVDAHTMSALGNGSADAGADVMDQVVRDVRQQAYGTGKQPNEINGLAALKPMMERT